MAEHVTEAEVARAVSLLESAGLYARGSCSLDWENSRRGGRAPIVIRGGTYVSDVGSGEACIRIVHGSFQIWVDDSAPPGFIVRWPVAQRVAEHRVRDLVEAAHAVIGLAREGALK